MAANAVQLPPPIVSGEVAPRPRVKVSVKKEWSGSGDDAKWQEAQYLEALSASNAVAPSMPTARFRWRSGDIMREGKTQYVAEPPVDLRDWFVKIELLGRPSQGSRPPTRTGVLWMGRFVDQDLQLGGDGGNGNSGPGDQDLTAFGLAYELDRSVINSAVVTNDEMTADYVNKPLTFNEDYVEGFHEVGNRSATEVRVDESEPARQGFVFANTRDASDNTKGHAWSLKNVIEYLLKFQGGVIPTGESGEDGSTPTKPMFTLEGDDQLLKALDLLVFPNVRVDGLSVFTVLNELLDRRRGLGWCVRIDSQEKLTVHVFTTIGEAVVVGDALLPANSEASKVDLSNLGHLIRSQQFSLTAGQRYDRIVVTGEPLLVCFSLSFPDKTLRKGWYSNDETNYRLALGSDASPINNEMERADDRFREVYARFLLPADWDGKAGDGEGGDKYPVNIGFNDDGSLAVGTTGSNVPTPKMRVWGRTFLRTIPLRVRNPTADDREPEYRPLMALVWKDPIGTGNLQKPGRFFYADLGSLAGEESANVRPLDRDGGAEVRFSPNHLLAKNHFVIANAGPTLATPLYDYEKMILTVAMRTDERLRVKVDVTENQGGLRRTLEIRIPRAETWYIAKGTVTGIENSKPKRDTRSDKDRIVRDDSVHLRRVAAMAKAWYGTPRATMELTLNDVTIQPLGAYVRSVIEAAPAAGSAGTVPGEPWQAPVNSVISQVAYDLIGMRTTIRTHYQELDGTEAARGVPGFTIR